MEKIIKKLLARAEEWLTQRVPGFDMLLGALKQTGRVIFVASFAINILALVLPIVILQTYDRVIPNKSMPTLILLVAGLGVAILLDGAMRFARAYYVSWSGARLEHQLACKAIGNLLAADQVKLEREAAGPQYERLLSIERLRDFYAGQGALVLVDLPFMLIFLLLIALIGGALVFVPLVLIACFIPLAHKAGDQLRQALEQRSQIDDRRLNFLLELLGGIHTVKAMVMENLMIRRYERMLENAATASEKTAFSNAVAQGMGSLFSQATMVLVVLFGSIGVLSGHLSVGALAACTMLAARTVQPLLRGLGVWSGFQGVRVAHQKFDELMHLEPARPHGLAALPPVKGGIELKDVSLRLDNQKPAIFERLSLTVNPGDTVAIFGKDGSGRSLLLQLMTGLRSPSSGQVLIDGMNIANFDAESIASQVGILQRHSVLFHGTLMENLTTFRYGPYEEEAARIAVRLGLDRYVARLPDGFNTIVGGTAMEKLPSGMKQVIAMARVLVNSPKILLFDEASTAMDRESDERFTSFLRGVKGEHTLILVTERPSLARMADHFYEIQDGRLEALDGMPRVMKPRLASVEPAKAKKPSIQSGPAAEQA